MKVIIETYGTQVSIETGVLVIETEKERREISMLHITSLHIHTAVRISSDVLVACVKSNIPVYFENDFEVTALLWSPNYGSIANIRKKQALFAYSGYKYQLIKRLLVSKNENRIQYLKHISIKPEIKNTVEELERLNQMIMQAPHDDAQLRSLEAHSAKKYFSAFKLLLPPVLSFDKRTYQNSKDPVNSLLNYGYGILYNEITKALIIAGLDPNLGFFHAAQYNRPGLSYDMIEPYRVWCERQVIRCVRSKAFKDLPALLDKHYRLTKDLKHLFIEFMTDWMTKQKIQWHKRLKTPQTHIQLDAHKIAQYLLNFSQKDLLSDIKEQDF